VLLRLLPEPRRSAYHFEVIDGARRLDDAKREGLERIPAIVLPPETSDLEAAAHRITANLSRRANPAHESAALQQLYDAYRQQGVAAEDAPKAIAVSLGISLGVVKQRLKLTTLPPTLRQAVAEGKVAATVAGSAANLTWQQQAALAERFQVAGKLSAADVEEVRRVEREEQLAGLGEALLALDGRPEPHELFKQAIRHALGAGIEPDELLAAVREVVLSTAKEVGRGGSQG